MTDAQKVAEGLSEHQIKMLAGYLWNAVGNKTPALAKNFGNNGWYRLVDEAVRAILQEKAGRQVDVGGEGVG